MHTRRRDLMRALDSTVSDLGAHSATPPVVYAPFPLDLERYAELVRSSDIGLLLYDSTRYYARCSGVLLEMLSAGVPVIVPGGCWLSEQIHDENQRHLRDIAARATAMKQISHANGAALPFTNVETEHRARAGRRRALFVTSFAMAGTVDSRHVRTRRARAIGCARRAGDDIRRDRRPGQRSVGGLFDVPSARAGAPGAIEMAQCLG